MNRSSGSSPTRRLPVSLGAMALLPIIVTAAHAAAAADTSTQTMRKVAVSADAEPAEDSYTAPASASATPLDLSLRETPQSVTVFTEQRIEDQNLTSLRDVLDNTAGVYSYAYDTERVVFTSRGFPIDTLLYDGIPAVDNFNTDSIAENIDTAPYQRVEIVRGATGLMTGAGSPAASVNLVRKHADSADFAASLDLTLGSWDDRRIEGDLTTPLNSSGSVRARFVGAYQERDSYQDVYHGERKVFYGIVDADLTPDTLLSIGFDYQDDTPTGVTWGSFPLFFADGTPANWSRSVTTAADWTYWNRRTQSVFAELKHSFANGWTLQGSLTRRKYDEDLELFYVYDFPDAVTGEGLQPWPYRSDGRIDEKALSLQASGPFTLFGRQHELVLGYNGSKSDYSGHEFDDLDPEWPPVGNFFEWDGSYPHPNFDTEGYTVTDIDARQNGAYVAARFVLADPLKLIAGARYATWDTDHFYLYDSPDVTFHDKYEKTIPYAGLIFDVSRDFSLFASYTEIFKPQTARDVNLKYLDPIEGRSFEVGIKGEHLDGLLNTSLTLFKTDQSNVAAPLFDPETGDPVLLPDLTQASYAIDGTESRGFELEVSGQIAAGWNASLGWSKYRIEDADGNDVRTYIPRSTVRGFTTWTPQGLQALTIGGGINWQSDSHTLVPSPDGNATQRQTDITLVSLMARYAFTPALSLQLNGENLLDKKYYVLDEYGNSYYGAPIRYAASLSWKF